MPNISSHEISLVGEITVRKAGRRSFPSWLVRSLVGKSETVSLFCGTHRRQARTHRSDQISYAMTPTEKKNERRSARVLLPKATWGNARRRPRTSKPQRRSARRSTRITWRSPLSFATLKIEQQLILFNAARREKAFLVCVL